MKITFNELGVLIDTITDDESYRQGNVGNTLTAVFEGKNANEHIATIVYTRPDGSKIARLPLTLIGSDSYRYTFNDAWFMAISGIATLTIYLHDSKGNIVANGQVQFNIEKTDTTDITTITPDELNAWIAQLASKLDINSTQYIRFYPTIKDSNYSELPVGTTFGVKETINTGLEEKIQFYQVNNRQGIDSLSTIRVQDFTKTSGGFSYNKTLYTGRFLATPNTINIPTGLYLGWRDDNVYYFIVNGKFYTTDVNLTSGSVSVVEDAVTKITRLTNLLVDENMQVRGQIYKGMGTPTENEEVLNRGEVVTEIGEFIDSNLKDTNGKIKSDFLPSYVDDILEFATFDKFPTTGETGKIYVDMENNNIYRWSGTQYTLISSIDLLELEKQLSRKANKDGYYTQMRVGLSDNLVSPDLATDETPYTFRPTAGVENVSNGLANLRSVKGNTIVWNQLYKQSVSWTTETKNGITITNNKDGSFTINGTNEGQYTTSTQWNANFPNTPKLISGHKYLATINSSTCYIHVMCEGQAKPKDIIFEAPNDYFIYNMVAIGVYPLATVNNETVYPQIFDLTLMFGAGNEPATVEEFKAMFPNSYYEYNSGELVNVNVTGIKSVGFNAWDEEWEVGSINTSGQNEASTARIRSKNYIPVIPGEKYRITYISQQRVCWYNENYEFVKAENYLNANRVLTAPDGAHYARIMLNGADYSNKCCFNLSHSGYRDGEYEPYKTDTLHLDTSVYFPDGMKKAGSAYDELTYYKAIKRIGGVDLGTLNPDYSNSSACWRIQVLPSDRKQYTINMLCEKYTIAKESASLPDKTIWVKSAYNYIYIKDSLLTSEMTAEQVKEALSGVILYYELAEPVETETNFTEDWFYDVDDFGTEQWLQTGIVNIPVPHTTLYTRNLRDDIRTLSEKIPNNLEVKDNGIILTNNGNAIGNPITFNTINGNSVIGNGNIKLFDVVTPNFLGGMPDKVPFFDSIDNLNATIVNNSILQELTGSPAYTSGGMFQALILIWTGEIKYGGSYKVAELCLFDFELNGSDISNWTLNTNLNKAHFLNYNGILYNYSNTEQGGLENGGTTGLFIEWNPIYTIVNEGYVNEKVSEVLQKPQDCIFGTMDNFTSQPKIPVISQLGDLEYLPITANGNDLNYISMFGLTYKGGKNKLFVLVDSYELDEFGNRKFLLKLVQPTRYDTERGLYDWVEIPISQNCNTQILICSNDSNLTVYEIYRTIELIEPNINTSEHYYSPSHFLYPITIGNNTSKNYIEIPTLVDFVLGETHTSREATETEVQLFKQITEDIEYVKIPTEFTGVPAVMRLMCESVILNTAYLLSSNTITIQCMVDENSSTGYTITLL